MTLYSFIISAVAGIGSGIMYGALFLNRKWSASFIFITRNTCIRIFLLISFWLILLHFVHIDLILTTLCFLPVFWGCISYYKVDQHGRS